MSASESGGRSTFSGWLLPLGRRAEHLPGRTLLRAAVAFLMAVFMVGLPAVAGPGTFLASAQAAVGDLDGDGVPDTIDLDDDNDGILDTVEGSGATWLTTIANADQASATNWTTTVTGGQAFGTPTSGPLKVTTINPTGGSVGSDLKIEVGPVGQMQIYYTGIAEFYTYGGSASLGPRTSTTRTNTAAGMSRPTPVSSSPTAARSTAPDRATAPPSTGVPSSRSPSRASSDRAPARTRGESRPSGVMTSTAPTGAPRVT